ncbi:MAG: histidine kinase dimerization/phosphoacceptor domain-containing protein [Segetibacter sp.]
MQTLRNHISADMHDEIGSTLSSISFYSQALLIQTNDEKHKKVLEKIKENAQIAQEGMSDIIWSVKGSMDGMENVFNRMQSFGTEFLESKEIIFSF